MLRAMDNGTENKLDGLPLCQTDRLLPCLLKKGHYIVQAWKTNSFRLCFNIGEFAYSYRTKGRQPLTAHNCHPLSTYKQSLLFTVRDLKQILAALRKPYFHCFPSSSDVADRCDRNTLNVSSLFLMN